MSAIKPLLLLLIFPILLLGWIIYWKLWGKKQSQQAKKRREWAKKLLVHMRNFSPTRGKNRTWQRSIGKDKKKRKKTAKK